MRVSHFIRPCGLLALLGAASAAHAQDFYYPADATINYTIIGSAHVGYANQTDINSQTNGTSPTVSLVSGGSIIGGPMTAYNNSTVNVTGGYIGSSLTANNSSTVNVSGGNFATVFRFDLGGYSDYSLSGTLADGTVIKARDLFVQDNSGAKITFNLLAPAATPEPGSVALLVGMATVGAGVLRRKRRK